MSSSRPVNQSTPMSNGLPPLIRSNSMALSSSPRSSSWPMTPGSPRRAQSTARSVIDLSLPGNGVRLAATRWAGTGTPVLLLHGRASQRRFWNLVVPELVGRPVCAVDQRGHGDSDKPDDGYDLRTVATDATTALDALGWSRAVVVGNRGLNSLTGRLLGSVPSVVTHRAQCDVLIVATT